MEYRARLTRAAARSYTLEVIDKGVTVTGPGLRLLILRARTAVAQASGKPMERVTLDVRLAQVTLQAAVELAREGVAAGPVRSRFPNAELVKALKTLRANDLSMETIAVLVPGLSASQIRGIMAVYGE